MDAEVGGLDSDDDVSEERSGDVGGTSIWERQGDSRVNTKSMPTISGSRLPSEALVMVVDMLLLGVAEPDEGGETNGALMD